MCAGPVGVVILLVIFVRPQWPSGKGVRLKNERHGDLSLGFLQSSHTGDLEDWYSSGYPPGARYFRVSAGTGWLVSCNVSE